MGWPKDLRKKYAVKTLVYFEVYSDIEAAITREKKIEKRNRAWKIKSIEERNPNWDDLYNSICR